MEFLKRVSESSVQNSVSVIPKKTPLALEVIPPNSLSPLSAIAITESRLLPLVETMFSSLTALLCLYR